LSSESAVSATALAAAGKLQRVGTRPPLVRYFNDVYKRRAFAFTMAKYQMQATTAKSRLGVAWHIVVPALQISVYGVIFGLILGSSRPAHFLPYLITGIVLFQFVSGAFADGAKSIITNASLVRSLNFPRVLLPLAAVMSNILVLVPLVGIMLIVVACLGEPVTWAWLLMVPLLILLGMFGLGLAMVAARLTVSFADLGQLIPFLTRVAFYASGIFFNVDKLVAGNPILTVIFGWNPIHIYLKLARSLLVTGYGAGRIDWVIAVSWAFGMLVFGFIFFWRAEERYGRNV
jgi:teichoic acid transport system permease protein